MIVKGKSRGNAAQLAAYLLSTEENERATVLSNDYGQDTSLHDALADMEALASITRGHKGLYHAQISPEQKYAMSPEQWLEAADILEESLGLTGQQRVIVLHTKHQREHAHVVWCRTDVERGRMISDSHNYAAHEQASAVMEVRFDHDRIVGVHFKRDPAQERPRALFDFAEWQQAQRTGIDPRQRKTELTALYERCDSGQAFRQALEQDGYVLARGDRRSFVILDRIGEVHSLSRQLHGHRAADIRAKLADVEAQALPDVEQARQIVETRARAQFDAHPEKRPAVAVPSPVDSPAPRHKAAEQRARSLEDKRQAVASFLATAKEKSRSFREEQRDALEQETEAMQAERSLIEANQQARGFLIRKLADWLGISDKEEHRLAELQRDYEAALRDQEKARHTFEKRQVQDYLTLQEAQRRQRLEEERALKQQFRNIERPGIEPEQTGPHQRLPDDGLDGPEPEP